MEHKERKKRRYFLTGLLIVVPLLVSVYLFVSLFSFFDNILGRYINGWAVDYFGFHVPGLGILLFVLVIFVTGFFATNFIGRRLVAYFERLWTRFPVAGRIYTAAQQVTRFLFGSSMSVGEPRKVVLVEYPRKGLYTIGFATKESDPHACAKSGQRLVNVLIPSVPSPLTGFLVLVPREELIFLDIGVDEAMKIIISGGVLDAKDTIPSKPAFLSD
ncbi:MAG: DUF502 domain-containing protein [Deltaproteobacteria bacterium]